MTIQNPQQYNPPIPKEFFDSIHLLSSVEVKVALAIYVCLDRGEEPSLSTLEKRAGLARPTVVKARRSLEERGYIPRREFIRKQLANVEGL